MKCNKCITRLVELLNAEELLARLTLCLDEEEIAQRIADYYRDRMRILLPDAVGVIEVGIRGGDKRMYVLAVVEEGGGSSIHDIRQGIDSLETLHTILDRPVGLDAIIYHLEGRMARTATGVHGRRRGLPRVVLVSGCCSLTRHTIRSKLAKPLREMLR